MRGTLMQWGERPCDGVVFPSKCAACVLDQRGLPKPLAMALGRVPLPVARAASKMPGRVATMLSMGDVVRRNLDREREIPRDADRFVVLTEGARRILHANGVANGRVVVNPLGIGCDVPASAPDRIQAPVGGRMPLRIGYVGRFDPIKGVEILVRAVAALPHD